MMKTMLNIGSLVLTMAVTLPVEAHTEIYTSLLAPEGVVSSGTGTARLTFDLDLLTMRVQAEYANLSSNVTASHIHCCQMVAESGNASVVTTTPTFPSFPTGTSGSYDMTFDMNLASSWNGNGSFVTANGGTTGAFNALYAAIVAHKAYLNIHTVNNGGGEIRAGRFNLVPEPASLAVALLAASCVLTVRRRPLLGGKSDRATAR